MGIVIGPIAGGLLVIAVGFYLYKRRKRMKKQAVNPEDFSEELLSDDLMEEEEA